MIVNAIYNCKRSIQRIYHKSEIVFQCIIPQVKPVIFQEIDTFVEPNDTLIIHGAYSANSFPDGLYLDCEPEVEWTYPVQDGNVLTIEQVYSATLNGNVLEVE